MVEGAPCNLGELSNGSVGKMCYCGPIYYSALHDQNIQLGKEIFGFGEEKTNPYDGPRLNPMAGRGSFCASALQKINSRNHQNAASLMRVIIFSCLPRYSYCIQRDTIDNFCVSNCLLVSEGIQGGWL